MEKVGFNSLPFPLLHEILILLPKRSLLYLMQVNKSFYQILRCHLPNLLKEVILLNQENLKISGMEKYSVYKSLLNHRAGIFCKQLEEHFWKIEAFDFLGRDYFHWSQLQRIEKHFYSIMLFSLFDSFFPGLSHVGTLFQENIKLQEAQKFYSMQSHLEMNHSLIYNKFIESFVNDQSQLSRLTNTNWFLQKQKWVDHWLMSTHQHSSAECSFSVRLAAFIVAKRLFSCSPFSTFFWLEHHQLVQGFTSVIKLIVRDRDLFADFALFLFESLELKPSPALIEQIIVEAAECEKQFIREFPPEHIGLETVHMEQFVEFIANTLLVSFGIAPLYFQISPPSNWGWIQLSPIFSKKRIFSSLSFSSSSTPQHNQILTQNSASLLNAQQKDYNLSSSCSSFLFTLNAEF